MNNTRIFFFIFIILLIFGVVIFISNFNKDKSQEKSKQNNDRTKQSEEINIALTPLSPLEVINQVIVDQKYDQKQGFTLKTKLIDSGDLLLLLLNREIEISFIGPLDMAIIAKGKDISMVSPALKMVCPFLVKSTSGIKDFASMRGKKLGILKKPIGPYNTLELAMKLSGLKMSDYFKITEADLLALPSLLLNGDVDVINTCNILSVAKLLAGNKTKIVDSSENIIKRSLGNDAEIPAAGIIARSEWIKNNKALLKSYIKARDEALLYISTNSSLITGLQYREKYKLTPEEADILKKLTVDTNYFTLPDWKKSIEYITALLKNGNTQLTGSPEENFFLNL